jgi:hypothetical protein
MSPKELKTLIKTLRANGVVSYENNGLKLLLDPNHISASESKTKAKSPAQVLQEQVGKLIPDLTDEEWLLSTNRPIENSEDQVQ